MGLAGSQHYVKVYLPNPQRQLIMQPFLAWPQSQYRP